LDAVCRIGVCEAVLYITKAMYMHCCVELEILKTEKEAAEKEDPVAGSNEEENPEEPPNRDHALALQDTSDKKEEAAAAPVKRQHKGKGKPKILSPMEEHDQQYFLEYITTTKCRRIMWNKYFGNQSRSELSNYVGHQCPSLTISSERLNLPVLKGPCCDNCNREALSSTGSRSGSDGGPRYA
jgi:hypothetical protein